ncbi:MAG: hypothetical protein LBI64_00605, partial [Coriobacteriales bacterium]|nr:hypothetical protein [Coriobacteriales bacterium]
MAHLEGWHIDPENRRQFRYHDGTDYTERVTTDIAVVTLPFGLFGKRFFGVTAELIPLIMGTLAILGWLWWFLAGVVFGILGLWLGVSFLRIGRTVMLLIGTILAAIG